MSTFTVGVIVWIVAGVLAALVLLGRQGYRDWRWYVLGAVFGPLFIPIAAERANRSVAVVEAAEPAPGSGTSIVVGVDGSAARTGPYTWPRRCSTPRGCASSS